MLEGIEIAPYVTFSRALQANRSHQTNNRITTNDLVLGITTCRDHSWTTFLRRRVSE